MRIVLNEKRLKRYLNIAKWASLGGLILFFGGMYLTFGAEQNPAWAPWAFAALLFGFLITQVGIYYGNRYGRMPRVDQLINRALKGVSREYTMYHYVTPASHVLVGPAGIWVIIPKYQRGKITYRKGRWRQSGGPLLWYLRIFSQEGLGRPDLEIQDETQAVIKVLQEIYEDEEQIPPVEPLLVFTSPKAELVDVEEAPVPTLKVEDLKAYLKPKLKRRVLKPAEVKRICEALERAGGYEPDGASISNRKGRKRAS